MFSVLSSARWIASPTSAISSDRPVWASPIRTVASAAVYCALMTSLRVRKVSTLAFSRALVLDQPLLLGLEVGDLGVEALQLGLHQRLALERGAGQVLAAGAERGARLLLERDHRLPRASPSAAAGASSR